MPVPSNSARTDYDIVIVGGGLVGASLALAAADTRYRVAVIEAVAFDLDTQPSYDERTIALTYSAKHIFRQLGVWDEVVEKEACAINSIHISNRGHFGMTRLDHRDVGTEALGYVVATRALGQALMQRLGSLENVEFFCPYEARRVDTGEHHTCVRIEQAGHKNSINLKTSLLVIADGGRSPLLNTLGFARQSKHYTQSALLSIVQTSIDHQHIAYERFVEDGPLALLPMNSQRFAVVWTLSPEALERISILSDEQYLQELQMVFGTRAGMFSRPTPRKAYPLSKSVLETPYKQGILALGNAAHTVHPVAGQGFNLGLRDVAELAERLVLAEHREVDIGSPAFLQAYSESRRQDTHRVGQFTDSLLTIFTHRSPLIQLGRNLGLAAIENLPFVKRALLKRTMGLDRNQPRLARGLMMRRESGDD